MPTSARRCSSAPETSESTETYRMSDVHDMNLKMIDSIVTGMLQFRGPFLDSSATEKSDGQRKGHGSKERARTLWQGFQVLGLGLPSNRTARCRMDAEFLRRESALP